MIDISEIQFSVNRAVSSVFGFNGPVNELDSLKSLCSALESLNFNKRDQNLDKFLNKGTEYEFGPNYYVFLDNLKRILSVFCSRVISSNSINDELAHLYIRLFLVIAKLLKNGNISFNQDLLTNSVVKIWCDVLCLGRGNQIDSDLLKTNHDVLVDFIPLVLTIYKSSENEKELNKLLFIILDIFKHTDDECFLDQIIESLGFIPNNLNVIEVYPGLVSRIFNKLKDLNRKTFLKSMKSLSLWINYVLDYKKVNYSNDNHLNSIVKTTKEKDEVIEKTEECIRYIIKRFKKFHLKGVSYLCLSLVDYEILDVELRHLIGKCLLDAVSDDELWEHISTKIKSSSVSFKLILRDLITKSVNGNLEDCKEVFRSYLRINESISWEIDHYLALKFLITITKLDFSGLERRFVVNKKYLVYNLTTVPDELPDIVKESESLSFKYFEKLSIDTKINSLSNLLSVLKSTRNNYLILKVLHLMNEVLSTISDFEDRLRVSEIVLDLKSVTISDKMFSFAGDKLGVDNIENTELVNKIDDKLLRNLYKFELIRLVTFTVNMCKRGDLSHKDIQNVLFNTIPEYNSDYVTLSQCSLKLLEELNGYFNKYIRKDEYLSESEGLSVMMEYYTQSLVKRMCFSIGKFGVSDILYSLTSFDNKSFDIKGIYDLTVQLCKYFDDFSGGAGDWYSGECCGQEVEEEESGGKGGLIRGFYSFNYILIYLNKYFINGSKRSIHFGNCPNSESIGDFVNKEVDDTSYNDQSDEGEEEEEDDDGKGNFMLSVATLIITRARYCVYDPNPKLKYLSLLALYRGLILVSESEYIFRIRIHEVWDCLTHTMEININNFKVIGVLLEIFKFISIKVYHFIEKKLMRIFEYLENIVFNDNQVVGIADEKNSTIRYKCYYSIVELLEYISKKVLNRCLFSQLMLISIMIYSPKTCNSIKIKLDQIFWNLAKKDPTLVRNVVLEVNKGDKMNEALIKYAFKRDLRTLLNKIPPHISIDIQFLNYIDNVQ